MPNGSDFDAFAMNYNDELRQSLGVFSGAADGLARYKIKLARRLLPDIPDSILDYGCGVGRSIPHLANYFPNSKIFGCDMSADSIAVAAGNYPQASFFACDSLDSLSGTPGTFDMVFVSCVLHHISGQERSHWCRIIASLLSPKGTAVVFEHNPYNPVTRHIVRHSPLDVNAEILTLKECVRLFRSVGLEKRKSLYTLFFPIRNRILDAIERPLAFLPLGGQYCAMFRRPG